MKTQQEIVIKAKAQAESIGNEDGTSAYDYVMGYKQCQEDIVQELEMHILVNEHNWSRNPQAELKDFINSLNK